ncbi:hypothetical protein ACFQGE_10265 [Halomicroarcula sp. GCM10025817]|uniref:hypothetical protein n=1 Tax=Halomicroarcula sp. GCM10025817 TaxID=3252672 RepID=UPI00360C0F2B
MSGEEYDIKWRRDSNKPRPEDELDVESRREALQEILEDLDVEEEVELKPVGRKLGGDLPYFTIANLALATTQTAIMLKNYIENQGDKAVLSDEIKEKIDEYHEDQ